MIRFVGVFFLCIATVASGSGLDDGFDLIEKRNKSVLELANRVNKEGTISEQEKKDIFTDVDRLINLSNELIPSEVETSISDLDMDNLSTFESAVSVLLYDIYDLFNLAKDNEAIKLLDTKVEKLK